MISSFIVEPCPFFVPLRLSSHSLLLFSPPILFFSSPLCKSRKRGFRINRGIPTIPQRDSGHLAACLPRQVDSSRWLPDPLRFSDSQILPDPPRFSQVLSDLPRSSMSTSFFQILSDLPRLSQILPSSSKILPGPLRLSDLPDLP